MTLILDLENWFKVTAYLLPKTTLYVKYEPDSAQGRDDKPGQVISDGKTDGPTDHNRAPAKRGPIY